MNSQKIQVARKKFGRARAVFALGVLPACALLLSGCGRGAKPEERRPDPTAGGKAPRIVVIAGEPGANWNAARNGAMAAGKAMGADIEWHAPMLNPPPPETSNAKNSKPLTPIKQQDEWIEEATENNASGIVVAPINATELVPPINYAGKRFVPTLAFDAPAYTKYKLTFVKNDDRAAGVLAAQHALTILRGENRVAVLQVRTDSGGAQSAESFASTLRKTSSALQIASPANAAAAAPGVLFAPDEITARAALKLVLPQTLFIAVGSSDDLIAGLKSGKIAALIVPDRYEMAYQSVSAIFDYRAHRPPPNEIEIAPVLVTKENLTSEKSRRVLGLK